MRISWFWKDGEDTIHLFETEGECPVVGQEVYIHNHIRRDNRSAWRNGELSSIGEYPKNKFVVQSAVVALRVSDVDIDTIDRDLKPAPGQPMNERFEDLSAWVEHQGYLVAGLLAPKRALVMSKQTAEVVLVLADRK